MRERFEYDLGNASFVVGKMGCLSILNVIPVIPGDSISIDAIGVVKLTPFRRQIVIDSKWTIATFFVPHTLSCSNLSFREDFFNDTTWQNANINAYYMWVVQGMQQANSLPNATVTTHFFPWVKKGDIVPRQYINTYYWIYNSFFRHVAIPTARPEDVINPTDGQSMYGLNCVRMPTFITAGVPNFNFDSMKSVKVTADSTGDDSTYSLTDEAQVRAEYKNRLDDQFKSYYFADRLRSRFGVDKKGFPELMPRMLGKTSTWLSGHDIHGTADGNLGVVQGNVATTFTHRIPTAYFSEHGTIMTVAVPRFPYIHLDERNLIVGANTDTHYALGSGDPEISGNTPPRNYLMSEMFQGGSSNYSAGMRPALDSFRFNPNIVHKRFADLEGYPFQDAIPTDMKQTVHSLAEEYDSMFQSEAQGHWNCSTKFNVSAKRVIPPGERSIYAGAEVPGQG